MDHQHSSPTHESNSSKSITQLPYFIKTPPVALDVVTTAAAAISDENVCNVGQLSDVHGSASTSKGPSNPVDGVQIIVDNEVPEGDNDNFHYEAESSKLINCEAKDADEAYNLYNDYAYKVGFSVRKGKTRPDRDGQLLTREFVCSREGFKRNNGKTKQYTKSDIRTGCKANVIFSINQGGGHLCIKHNMEHNHAMTPPDKRHWLRSQRKVSREQTDLLCSFKDNGMGVADVFRYLKKQAGSFQSIGFTARDAFNVVDRERRTKLDGRDIRQLIKYFSDRQAKEPDFYYDLELDDEGHIIGIFWRDGQMRKDYESFSDLVVFDTTFRTNKYKLICAHFVGMNHHTKNVMFGIGFLVDERHESFVWLFNTFLKSMGGIHPITIMTDQCASMAKSIEIVFPQSRHRLCTWHIGKNAQKNISHLMAMKGFSSLFNYVLKYTDTVAEFEHYWSRMMYKYNCHQNKWLIGLYSLKEKWCPAYSKKYFSGGILSSQRSETTNKSVSHRLSKTGTMCDFYNHFNDVIDEWRNVENGDDNDTMTGNRHLAFYKVSIVLHAKELYTREIGLLFEKNYIDSNTYSQKVLRVESDVHIYHVWRQERDRIMHVVRFNPKDDRIDCTCNYFSETGLLCVHSLRVYLVNCVGKIPDWYVFPRWTKAAIISRGSFEQSPSIPNFVPGCVWKNMTIRNIVQLVSTCQDELSARTVVDTALDNMKKSVEELLESLMASREQANDAPESAPTDNANVSTENTNDIPFPTEYENVQDPIQRREKYVRNERLKSTFEKKCNQTKGWKRKQISYIEKTKQKAQASVQAEHDLPPDGMISQPLNQNVALEVYVPDDYFGVTFIPPEAYE